MCEPQMWNSNSVHVRSAKNWCVRTLDTSKSMHVHAHVQQRHAINLTVLYQTRATCLRARGTSFSESAAKVFQISPLGSDECVGSDEVVAATEKQVLWLWCYELIHIVAPCTSNFHFALRDALKMSSPVCPSRGRPRLLFRFVMQ